MQGVGGAIGSFIYLLMVFILPAVYIQLKNN